MADQGATAAAGAAAAAAAARATAAEGLASAVLRGLRGVLSQLVYGGSRQDDGRERGGGVAVS